MLTPLDDADRGFLRLTGNIFQKKTRRKKTAGLAVYPISHSRYLVVWFCFGRPGYSRYGIERVSLRYRFAKSLTHADQEEMALPIRLWVNLLISIYFK